MKSKILKKLLMVSLIDINSSGAYRDKLKNQLNYFRSKSFEVSFVALRGERLILGKFDSENYDLKPIKQSQVINSKILRRFIFFWFVFKVLFFDQNIKYLFFRYPRPDFLISLLLLYINIFRRNIKTIYEIPTYPFKFETRLSYTLSSFIENVNSLIFNRFVIKTVSIIAVVAFEGKIFNRKVVRIENGVNLNLFPKKLSKKKVSNKLKLVMTAHFNDTNHRHGLDRLLKGMFDYYKNKKNKRIVELYIIGSFDTNFSSQVNNLIKQALLSKRIKFLGERLDEISEFIKHPLLSKHIKLIGNKWNEDLYETYQSMHIGVGCLAFHRVGVNFSSALKEREYFAMGMPVVSASPDYLVPKESPYRYTIDQDDSNVNIHNLLNYFDNVYSEPNVNQSIRIMASEMMNWDKCFENLFKEIETHD